MASLELSRHRVGQTGPSHEKWRVERRNGFWVAALTRVGMTGAGLALGFAAMAAFNAASPGALPMVSTPKSPNPQCCDLLIKVANYFHQPP